MVAPVFLAESAVRVPGRVARPDPRKLRLEGPSGVWERQGYTAFFMNGLKGHGLPPVEVVRESSPGVAGGWLREVVVQPRELFVPLYITGDGPVGFLEAMRVLEDVVHPFRDQGLDGTLKLVGTSDQGDRELSCVYLDGLEGEMGTSSGIRFATVGLRLLAVDPWARAREESPLVFQVGDDGRVFLTSDDTPEGLHPWPRAIASSSVVGQGMRVIVASQVPVWPTLEITGPFDSLSGTMNTGWSLSVPDGVPSNSVLRVVTDPRRRSARLDGQHAAGLIARGSVPKPFQTGVNILNMVAPGGEAGQSQIRLSWTDGFRSLW